MAEKKKKNTENQEPQADPKELETVKKELETLSKDFEAKKDELEALKKEMDEKKNDYLRLMAEFDTFRRRTAAEKLELVKSASADTIKGLLPVLDDCEIALSQLEKTEATRRPSKACS